MSGAIAMGTAKITGMGDPVANQDAATKKYSDDQDALKLSLTGGTLTGDITMGSNKVTTTADPVNADDLARKGYMDNLFGSTDSAAASAAAAAANLVIIIADKAIIEHCNALIVETVFVKIFHRFSFLISLVNT